MKGCSTLLAIREIQIKPQCDTTSNPPDGYNKKKKIDNNKY